MTFVFLRHVAEAHEMASNSGVATLRNFCWAVGPQKCLLGSLPKPGSLGQNGAVDKVPPKRSKYGIIRAGGRGNAVKISHGNDRGFGT